MNDNENMNNLDLKISIKPLTVTQRNKKVHMNDYSVLNNF
jgi:hypothetical protein